MVVVVVVVRIGVVSEIVVAGILIAPRRIIVLKMASSTFKTGTAFFGPGGRNGWLREVTALIRPLRGESSRAFKHGEMNRSGRTRLRPGEGRREGTNCF